MGLACIIGCCRRRNYGYEPTFDQPEFDQYDRLDANRYLYRNG